MNSASPPLPDAPVLAIPAAQDYLGGYSRRGIYQLATQGEIDMIKVGGRSMITRSSLDAYLSRQVAASRESRSTFFRT
jgi:hypothetical protein